MIQDGRRGGRCEGSLRWIGSARMLALALVLVAGSAASLLSPAEAQASSSRSSLTEGAPGQAFSLATPLSSAVLWGQGLDQSLTLATGTLQTLDAATPGYASLSVAQADPVGLDAMADGHLLVADEANHLVAEFDGQGDLVWSYTRANDASLSAPCCTQRLGDGRTLIVDRRAMRVFIVDPDGALSWQYGRTGVAGSGIGELDEPLAAEVLGGGNVAICDVGNRRVIVVRAGDYDAGEPDMGYTGASIVWQYGATEDAGSGVDHLVRPTAVQSLTAGDSRGNFLICDGGAGRVLEVRRSDYEASAPHHGFSDDSLVWQYPTGSALAAPTWAVGAYGSDAMIWVGDRSDGSVVGVSTAGPQGPLSACRAFARYASVGTPAALALTVDGSLAVADPGRHEVAVLGAVSESAVVWSRPLACGSPSDRKRFVSITAAYAGVPRAPIHVSYRIDDGPWTSLADYGGSTDIATAEVSTTRLLPPKTIGRRISYMITLANDLRCCVPLLDSISIAYEPWKSGSADNGGGGGGGTHAHSSGGASGVLVMSTSAGSGWGSGGGEGGGMGAGAGTGSGRGHGSGAGSPEGTDTGVNGDPSMAAVATADPSGTATGTDRDVSGYVLKAAGFAGGGEGGGESGPRSFAWPARVLGAIVLAGAVLASPVVMERRRLRFYTGYDTALARPFTADKALRARLPGRSAKTAIHLIKSVR
jgi:hypothetical protein